MWDLPPKDWNLCPVLADKFFTTEAPGTPYGSDFVSDCLFTRSCPPLLSIPIATAAALCLGLARLEPAALHGTSLGRVLFTLESVNGSS